MLSVEYVHRIEFLLKRTHFKWPELREMQRDK